MSQNLKKAVLEVYRITLLSNINSDRKAASTVLEVYRITLLSNTVAKVCT